MRVPDVVPTPRAAPWRTTTEGSHEPWLSVAGTYVSHKSLLQSHCRDPPAPGPPQLGSGAESLLTSSSLSLRSSGYVFRISASLSISHNASERARGYASVLTLQQGDVLNPGGGSTSDKSPLGNKIVGSQMGWGHRRDQNSGSSYSAYSRIHPLSH